MRVLGIDPGLRITGYAVIEQAHRQEQVIDAGVLRAEAAQPLEQRLRQLHDDLDALMNEYELDAMAVEELYAHYGHPRTAILMGHARGVFLLAAGRRNIAVHGFSATRIKKSLTGNGRATKEQMQRAVTTQLNLARPPRPADVADALAVALCCLNEYDRP